MLKFIFGTGHSDILIAPNAPNTHYIIFGFGGSDFIQGGDQSDLIFTGPGNNTVYALGGNDIVYGGWDNDTVFGGLGNDRLFGGSGNDRLYGDQGINLMFGGFGNDEIHSLGGGDYLAGGGGHDSFVFDSGAVGFASVRDFSVQDVLDFSALGKVEADLALVNSNADLAVDLNGNSTYGDAGDLVVKGVGHTIVISGGVHASLVLGLIDV
jgi:Ca2+-binding RTX toxin-like protein